MGIPWKSIKKCTPELVSPHFTLGAFRDFLEPGWEKPGHDPIILSNTHRCKDGSEYPVDVHLQSTLFDNRPTFVGYVYDVSVKQKELDQLRSVIKGAGQGYWDFNERKKDFFVDDKWLEMLGLARQWPWSARPWKTIRPTTALSWIYRSRWQGCDS